MPNPGGPFGYMLLDSSTAVPSMRDAGIPAQ
jgi:hypothetical protein